MEAEPFIEELPTPIKGKADWRTYRAFRLANGVTGLVIHDKESKTTGMSCVVNVGAAADPRGLSGLAHFCEHMCFLGSKKYPGENEYKRYLSAHGGRSNASTSMHSTNYKFEVLAEHAEKAVDIFSNFFIDPLFTSSGTSREVQAVDSENSKNLTADSRRRLQILKDLADPNHYYSKFSTGNAKTLDTNDPEKLEWIRGALLAFHRKHYRPQNMTVVIAGPQSLDVLQEWIASRYSKIPSTPSDTSRSEEKVAESEQTGQTEIERLIDQAAVEAPANSLHLPPPPFRPAFSPAMQGGSWPVLLTTKPLRSMRKLVLMWPLPSDKRTPDQSPSSIISHLLGHEGSGSAFAVLQDHGMLSSLSAGPRTRAPDFTLFQVDMGLTEKGEKHWKEVVELIFSYCRLLQTEAEKVGVGEEENQLHRIWGEMSRLDQLFFHQTSPGGAYSYAPNLAERVQAYGTEKMLSAGSMLEESESTLPREKIVEVVKLLNPSNCIIERCSQSAWTEAMNDDSTAGTAEEGMGKKIEPWYGVEYHLSRIDETTISAWEGKISLESEMDISEMTLPRPNRYIPRTLDLCSELPKEAKKGPRLEKPIDPPVLLVNNSIGRLFHRMDDRYALPQSSINLQIRNAAVQNVRMTSENGQHWQYDPNTSLLSSILVGAFSEAMAQETYDADLAGLYWSLNAGGAGIKLSCFGFSDRLPDLALKILNEFFSGGFLQESYFESTKDRIMRGLRTYFESRRADSHAVYYRDALLASKDGSIDESLAFSEQLDFETVQKHFEAIVGNTEIELDCLMVGNVSAKDAKKFYKQAVWCVVDSQSSPAVQSPRKKALPAGTLERRINPGEDIELHFASKNPEEENGAVIYSYQSSIPSFKGDAISHPMALQSSAAIRLISHMLREPLFNDLRTKQQLGYIVSAYYELGYSSRPNEELSATGPLTMPVDFITVAVLSRKLSPPDIAKRIDDFMTDFRETLVTMPESEIKDTADALSTKLLKPIPKLQTEASNQFGKIQRYAPELFFRHKKLIPGTKSPDDHIPWDSIHLLARKIKSLSRSDLLDAWDRMTHPSTRSRILSCVYGNTFPLVADPAESSINPKSTASGWDSRKRIKIVNRFSDIIELRGKLQAFGSGFGQQRRFSSLLLPGPSQCGLRMVGLGCVLGAGVLGIMVMRNQRRVR